MHSASGQPLQSRFTELTVSMLLKYMLTEVLRKTLRHEMQPVMQIFLKSYQQQKTNRALWDLEVKIIQNGQVFSIQTVFQKYEEKQLTALQMQSIEK